VCAAQIRSFEMRALQTRALQQKVRRPTIGSASGPLSKPENIGASERNRVVWPNQIVARLGRPRVEPLLEQTLTVVADGLAILIRWLPRWLFRLTH
jgi:hypothetical protein